MLVLVAVLLVSAPAQQVTIDPCPEDSYSLPMHVEPSCESASWFLPEAAIIAHKRNSMLRIVSRLGDGEHASRLHTRRLHNVRHFFETVTETEVTQSIGERVSGRGRIEVYAGKCLVLVAMADTNADLCTWNPEDGPGNPDYYPWKDKKSGCKRAAVMQRAVELAVAPEPAQPMSSV